MGRGRSDQPSRISERSSERRSTILESHAFHDRYGLPLSTRSATAARQYVEGVDRHLSRDAGSQTCFEAAVAADPGFALARAALAGQVGADRLGSDATAVTEYLGSLAAGASRWERRHIELVTAVISGQILGAALLAREQLADFPRDVLALQRAVIFIENGGRRDWPLRRLALLDGVAGAYGDDWYFLGVYARGHAEVGRFDEARRLAEGSLAGNPRSANAAHALAHVFYDTDEHASGAAFLGEWLRDYDPAAPYHCHLSWHLALFELARGRHDSVLQIYESQIRPSGDAHGRGRMLDAASLLWRCRLAGRPAEALPWEAVCRLADHWTIGTMKWTAMAHAALAYAAHGETAALARLVDHLRRLDGYGDPVAGRVVLPLVEGIVAFAEEAYDEALQRLEPIADDLVRIGGSHAQREVFEDTLLEAYLRAGRFERVAALVKKRLDRRPAARDLCALSRARAGWMETTGTTRR